VHLRVYGGVYEEEYARYLESREKDRDEAEEDASETQ
jgi:hypothetical protein